MQGEDNSATVNDCLKLINKAIDTCPFAGRRGGFVKDNTWVLIIRLRLSDKVKIKCTFFNAAVVL